MINTTPTVPSAPAQSPALPLRVLFAPGYPRLSGVKCRYQLSDTSFRGWGSIRGLEHWPATEPELREAMRNVISGVRNTARLEKGQKRVTFGAEFRTRMLAEDRGRRIEIDTMLSGVYLIAKMALGPTVPVGFSGPEDGVAGDYSSPMVGPKTGFNPAWNHRRAQPYIATIYGATPREVVERTLLPIALGPGFYADPILWIQHRTVEGQNKEMIFAAEVQEYFGRAMDDIAAREERERLEQERRQESRG